MGGGGISSVESDATLSGTGETTDPLGVADDAITADKIADGAVTNTKLGSNAVTNAKSSR